MRPWNDRRNRVVDRVVRNDPNTLRRFVSWIAEKAPTQANAVEWLAQELAEDESLAKEDFDFLIKLVFDSISGSAAARIQQNHDLRR